MRPLSYTQISTYQTCPLSYKLQYVDGLKAEAKWYFSFGDTLHRCAEHFFAGKLPGYPKLEELLSFYEQNWVSEGWPSPEEESRQKAYGEYILRDFWAIHSRDFRVPLATEQMFMTDIQGVKLRGYIDRIDKLETGALVIIDYKTNQRLFTKDYVEGFLQLTLYQLAIERMWDMPVERLALYHLRSNTAVGCGPRSPERLDEAKRLVTSVAENIAAGRFPATENQYCPCDFPQFCPYYRHLYGKPVPDSAKPGEPGQVDIVGVVERYAALQYEQKATQQQLDDLKDIVIQYCQTEGLNRVFGQKHSVTYGMIDRKGYDEEKVRPILESAGLWDQVTRLDPTRMASVLKSGDVPAEVKERIASLAEVASSYPRLWLKDISEDKEE